MLDSLVPDTDKTPETVRITFLQRVEQQNHDLRQIHVLDSVWRSKTGSTGKFSFEVYYDLLWNAAYQHNLIKATKQMQRKAFISHQNDPCGDFEHDPEEEDSTDDQNQDEPSPYSVFQSSFSSAAPKKPIKVFIQLCGEFAEAAKQMVIEYNKKIKVVSPKPHFHGGEPKPNPTLGKPSPNPQQVHLHEKDDPTRDQPHQKKTPTHTMVHDCITECGTDPSDIHNVMSVFNAKGGISSQDSPRNVQLHQRYVFARANQSTNHLIDRGANGGLAGADMRSLQKTHRKIIIVGIDDHDFIGLNVVSAAAVLDT